MNIRPSAVVTLSHHLYTDHIFLRDGKNARAEIPLSDSNDNDPMVAVMDASGDCLASFEHKGIQTIDTRAYSLKKLSPASQSFVWNRLDQSLIEAAETILCTRPAYRMLVLPGLVSLEPSKQTPINLEAKKRSGHEQFPANIAAPATRGAG